MLARAAPDEIAELVDRLLKSWRDPDMDDERAAVQSAAIVRIFERYPLEVLETVVEALPRRLSYYPTIAEVAAACDAAMAPLHRKAAADIAVWETNLYLGHIKLEDPEIRASVVDRLWPPGSRLSDGTELTETADARKKRVADMIAEGTDRRWRTPQKSAGSTDTSDNGGK